MQKSSIRAAANFNAIICPPIQKLVKCIELDFTTTPAIAHSTSLYTRAFYSSVSWGSNTLLVSFGWCGCFVRLANVYGCKAMACYRASLK